MGIPELTIASCFMSDIDCRVEEGKGRLVSSRRKGKTEEVQRWKGKTTYDHVVNFLDTEPVEDVGHENLEAHVCEREEED
jgi:hypothetical protein